MEQFNTIQEIFDASLAKFDPSKHTTNYAVNVSLSGEGGGQWVVRVQDGVLTFEEGETDDAQMSFAMKASDFIRHQNGKANTMVLYMRGKIKTKGNPKIGLKLQKVWPRG